MAKTILAAGLCIAVVVVWGLIKEKRRPSQANKEPPFTVQLIPGVLDVHICAHEIDDDRNGIVIPCWSYVSEGLERYGQQEIIFTLRRRPEDAPADVPLKSVLKMFRDIQELARQGRIVPAGGCTILRPQSGFLGIRGSCGWLYVRSEDLEGVEAPKDALAAILILGDETKAFRLGFAYRIAALLGASTRYYPCPPWSDRNREPVLEAEKIGQTPFGQVPSARITGATVRMERGRLKRPLSASEAPDSQVFSQGDVVHLTLPKTSLEEVQAALTEFGDAPVLAIFGHVDPAWDGMLAWNYGWGAPLIISPERVVDDLTSGGRLIGGSALLVVHADGADDQARLMEDGFMMSLSTESWSRLRQALRDGQPSSIPCTAEDGMSLELEWADD